MAITDLTLNYQNTFDDFRQGQRGHLAARGGGWFRWVVMALAAALAACVAALVAVGRARPPGVLGPLLDLAHLLLIPIAPWLLFMMYTAGLLVIRQRPPRARVIDVVRQTRQRAVTLDRFTVWSLAAVIVFCVLAQGWMSADADPQSTATGRATAMALPMLPYALVLLFLWLFVYRRLMRKAYAAQQAKLERPVTTTITAERVTFDDVLTTLSYRWPAFARCVETADLFLLYTTEVTFFMVPKRAFATAGDADTFRHLVAAWAQSRSAGFPVLPVPVVMTNG